MADHRSRICEIRKVEKTFYGVDERQREEKEDGERQPMMEECVHCRSLVVFEMEE